MDALVYTGKQLFIVLKINVTSLDVGSIFGITTVISCMFSDPAPPQVFNETSILSVTCGSRYVSVCINV